jgi:hypothetical protein
LRGCGRRQSEGGCTLGNQIQANRQNISYFELNNFNLEAIVIIWLQLACLVK